MPLAQAIATTFLHRPYIFLFLVGFLISSLLNMRGRRTVLFLVIGYSIALISEASSIRNGFPYGHYFYLYENMPGELMVFGVPVWDSLSYVFMAYASLATAEYFCRDRSRMIRTIFSASLLMVALDVLADPLALRGDQWFLGKIYGYAEPGFYFGIPFSNFAGWFLVATAIFSVFYYFQTSPHSPSLALPHAQSRGKEGVLGPLLYASLVLFNLILTVMIKEYWLAASGLLVVTTTFSLVVFLCRRRRQN
ncbi:MAG: carotenoid biosynthesis protein [Deltaproteobacteria bacterium]|nr:carotenoid biosynthesis protein [Deltaproteobacteria bacterium]